MDKATLSRLETGKAANPTYLTIRTYARALGKHVSWRIEDASPADGVAHHPGVLGEMS